jgi:Flp pilus assembly pilin Flp
MAEYGVVLAVITLVIVATILLLSGAIDTALSKVITALKYDQDTNHDREKKGGDDDEGVNSIPH